MNKYVLEYSNEQKCFHIQTVEEMLITNLRIAIAGGINQYQPLFINDSFEECNKVANKLKKEHKLSLSECDV